MLIYCFRSVVVITCASHAQGPRLEPGQNHLRNYFGTRLVFTISPFLWKAGTDLQPFLK